MARTNLGALLGNIEDHATPPADGPAVTAPRSDTTAPAIEAPRQPKAGKHKSAKGAPEPPPVDTVVAGSAAYLRFVRKETRLSEEQQNRLTQHARRLNRAKATGTPRITDNTLIRVAVDLLLSRIDEARGDDEAAILESLNQ